MSRSRSKYENQVETEISRPRPSEEHLFYFVEACLVDLGHR